MVLAESLEGLLASPAFAGGCCGSTESDPTRAAAVRNLRDLLPEGHLVRNLIEDHDRFCADLDRLETLLATFRNESGTAEARGALAEIREIVARLGDSDRHHHDEERVLFPLLRERGILGPPSKLTTDHELLRRLYAEMQAACRPDPSLDTEDLVDSARAYSVELRGHIRLENQVVFPGSLRAIGPRDPAWGGVMVRTG